ncbi:hypothetical protein AQUCO_01300555v1 [Aquilegia coerulea]|uniref:KIB1-4 beta-propeller domain-containing protein n=1 Tax=Aquilegia coerulea TaxID=218851 RepID=A0A2G5E293_AQUCA|nr:hypothetical protein AQUCO_01300555v1 [Aquilegia coerulea]
MEHKSVRIIKIHLGLFPSMKLIIHIDQKSIKVFFNNLGHFNYLLPSTFDTKERNWLDLPDHILNCISDLLIDINDYIRFGAVCRPWRYIYIENLRRHTTHRQLPLLMIPSEPCDLQNQTRSLYSLSENRVIPNFQIRLPHNKFCRGSSEGWLVVLDDNCTDVYLFNPFLSVDNKLELPHLTEFPHEEDEIFEGFLTKAVLSANPTSSFTNYVVMAIYGQYARLAFFKPGDKTWTPLDFEYMVIEDVIYFNDQFFAVNFEGTVFAFDVNHHHLKQAELAPPPGNNIDTRKFLVNSLGNLLLVRRLMKRSEGEYCTTGFEVFKLDEFTRNWVQVESLGDQTLFLGDNTSISISSSHYYGCKRNCIYFTDDYFEGYWVDKLSGPSDIGVFNLEDGSIKQHYPLKSNIVFPPPIWIEPTLQRCFN